MNKCKYELRDGYYIFEDFNFCLSELEISECVNESIDTDKIRKNRNELLQKVYDSLGTEDFMRLVHVLSGNCALAYFNDNREEVESRKECDCHHCCECWEKKLREIKDNTTQKVFEAHKNKNNGCLLNITNEVFSKEHNETRRKYNKR